MSNKKLYSKLREYNRLARETQEKCQLMDERYANCEASWTDTMIALAANAAAHAGRRSILNAIAIVREAEKGT